MYILCTVLSIICAIVVKWITERRKFFFKMSLYPEVQSTMPLLGNILDYLSPTEIIPSLMKYREECGKSFKLILGPFSTYIVTTNANLAKFILRKPELVDKSRDYDFLYNWLGDGLLTAPSRIWHKKRKLLTPVFHYDIIARMVNQFNSNSNILLKILRGNINKEIDVYPIIARCTLDMVCETSMGLSFNAQEENNSKFNQATRTLLQIVGKRVYSTFKQSNLLYKFTLDYWREKSVLKYLHQVTNSIIKQRRVVFENRVPFSYDDIGTRKRPFFLDILMEYGLSNEEVRDEVSTMMLAGHDTSATGIAFTLYLLSNHLEVQNKLYNEITTTLESDTEPTYYELQSMKYLEMVIKEALRLYPPVVMISRTVGEDVYYADTTLPKGVRAGIFIYGMHRESQYFEDPESFNPERFAYEANNNITTFNYIPFSAGPRNCIGHRFAMVSMKSAIYKIVRNFEILPVPDKKPILSFEIILKSINGIYIKLKERS